MYRKKDLSSIEGKGLNEIIGLEDVPCKFVRKGTWKFFVLFLLYAFSKPAVCTCTYMNLEFPKSQIKLWHHPMRNKV